MTRVIETIGDAIKLLDDFDALEDQRNAMRNALKIIKYTTEEIPREFRTPWEDAILRIVADGLEYGQS